MNLLESLNRLTKNHLGIGIVDAWLQAPQTREASQKAAQLAQTKHLREAVTIAEKALSCWSRKPGFWERLICQILLGKLVNQLTQQLQEWRKQVGTVDKQLASAKTLLKQDTGDPWETTNLTNIITIYQRCSKIIHDERILQAIQQCQQELQKRQQFQELVKQAQSLVENLFFKNAIATYQQAEELYSTQLLTQAIATATQQVPQEEAYDASLQRVRQGETEGKLRGAIVLLESALAKFPRTDGHELLHKLKSLVQGRELFRRGLAAEKIGDFPTAISLYTNAESLLPENTNCRIRLGLVTIKTQAWETALSYLEDLPGEQAAYLRGFVYAQQENLQIAYREWQGLSGAQISEQREILKILSQRQRLFSLQNIEELVKAENLEQAKIASREFTQKFGFHQLVEENLQEHIQPRLEAAVWQRANWQLISQQAENYWIAEPNIITLHNWAVANYYHAQQDSNQIINLIISLSTALANLHKDINLQDVPWLGTQSVDFQLVFNQVKNRIETFIDTIKDKNIEDYLKFRDCWRLETLALDLMDQPPIKGIKMNDIFLTPGCYNHYLKFDPSNNFNSIEPHQKILHCLYTNWGLAVAACVAGDSQRAIKLKPINLATSDLEIFAHNFVAYHEGCYHLQQQKWREAIHPLNQAKSEILANQEWQIELDRLCSLQRQNISEDHEHLVFAQFWYDILNSTKARAYLGEYKAERIREQLASKQISKQKALKELERIKLIDADNPIVIDLIQRIEVALAVEVIEEFLNKNNLEGAVKFAKQNQYLKVKNIVTEICVDILVDGFKSGKLGFEEIYDLGRWAYELSPDEPNIQEIYLISQELHEIHHLIKRDRYEEAVRRAKYSEYDAIHSYVGDYLMMTLIRGMKSETLSTHLVHQLGRWVYQLCPHDPDYQEIYRRLNIR
ncbi:Peptidase M, neutral zinc metallopeptidase, zinc-binding site [Trichormus variabilis ATCC 29413]|uniref:Peptidase M, neutral zinc metallopeptidase, zinc-binding site n=2 Tax=Anabaena variabilis TaxID=264691 RepID=Q3MDJ8_TRIV2|nr:MULTISPECIES: peptidase M [Nostocaceae]ABA20938.1 Peptidase M, neutral zinc metallopeptidase, zinc-binding site [Trichormus variabilis ATCC 29413]MBC1214208.1 peptidase M, neutral zinc metallopeptidase site [Trichormus variabilis ARAD]MBC1265613.1 peptidase M, neutral zinc metallopeptidase site [Trichormus variabilis FSR]MBC1301716.1 peptidase M, neutral zinc metallopeptidase site [Trichormus variabilis N2B]MBC1309913.1 peptidase M, neutral zinc metallopeptidase site [Trichormus variabilis 